MIKDVWAGDLALIELARGHTDAPSVVLEQLAGRGYLSINAAGVPSLTVDGQARARALRDSENDMRLAFQPGGFNTAGGSAIHS